MQPETLAAVGYLNIEGETMIFEYAGKWGQAQCKAVTDKKLCRIIEECVGFRV